MTIPLTKKDKQDADTQQIAREARDQVRNYFEKPLYLHFPEPIDEEDKVYVIILSSIERAREGDKDDLAERLRIAWSKYQHFFSVPPHGTLKQIRAMLEFMPPRK